MGSSISLVMTFMQKGVIKLRYIGLTWRDIQLEKNQQFKNNTGEIIMYNNYNNMCINHVPVSQKVPV